MLSLLLLAMLSAWDGKVNRRMPNGPLSVRRAIQLKFSYGVDLNRLRDKFVNESKFLDVTRQKGLEGRPLTPAGFSCARAKREGRSAAILVIVANATTAGNAWLDWRKTESQLDGLRRQASVIFSTKLSQYRSEGRWGQTPFARAIARDQSWREALEEAQGNSVTVSAVRSLMWPFVCFADEANGRWLLAYLRMHPWPSRSIAGDKLSGAAWLLAQHADTYPAFQHAALSRMGALLKSKDVDPAAYANLFDRVALADGKPQRYGTQIDFDRRRRCVSAPEIEEPSSIDDRRSSVGLGPLAVDLRENAELVRGSVCPKLPPPEN